MKKSRSILSFWSLCVSLLWGLALSQPVQLRAEYLTPEKAGFHHCALLYCTRESRNHDPEELKTLLVKHVNGQPTAQKGYDACLFLYFTVNGKRTEFGETVKADWEEILAAYFQREVNVPSLNQAAAELRKGGFLKDGKKIQVMFAVPWMNGKVRDFGDVDGDGIGEDLSTAAGREKVLLWYMDEVRNAMRGLDELELWGFYLMAEGFKEKDAPQVRDFCRTIHEEGFRALWIPYFQAPGVEMAYDVGFDAVIMQSNWTFRTKADETGARRNRLVNSARFSRENGMGVELEINPPPFSKWRGIYAESLAVGTQTGFQNAAGAAYFGDSFYWGTSSDPEDQALYSKWMDFLAGKPIAFPHRSSWMETREKDGSVSILCTLKEPAELRLFDVFLWESEKDFFHGTAVLEGRLRESDPWKPLAWRFRNVPSHELDELQNVTFAFQSERLKEFRVRLVPVPGSEVGAIFEAAPDFTAEPVLSSLAHGKPYKTSKEFLEPTYPDETGGQLLDGVTSGSWKEYVGWLRNASAEVFFDFGEPIRFDQVRVHFLEEPGASISVPQTAEMVWTEDSGKLTVSGTGPLPKNYGSSGDFKMNEERTWIDCRLPAPQTARALSISFQFGCWLFLSEVEFFLDGKPLPKESFSYTLSTQEYSQRADSKILYGDDGKMLTDGVVSGKFSEGSVGVSGRPLRVTLDLTRAETVRKASWHLFDGGGAGIWLPARGTFRTSEDGKTWTEPVPIPMPKQEKSEHHRIVPVTLTFPPRQARFIEAEFHGYSWLFITEVTAE